LRLKPKKVLGASILLLQIPTPTEGVAPGATNVRLHLAAMQHHGYDSKVSLSNRETGVAAALSLPC
jgi:hypothetical protein